MPGKEEQISAWNRPPDATEIVALLDVLERRYEANRQRHPGLAWSDVVARLKGFPDKLATVWRMEQSGGEPDVVAPDATSGVLRIMDCSAETPVGRRAVCYDRAGLLSRKSHPPADSAIDMAARIGVELLDPQSYLALQELGEFDRKTSSWLKTPDDVRALGGALFGDRRYGQVFIYHNGAESYFAVRGFRGVVLL